MGLVLAVAGLALWASPDVARAEGEEEETSDTQGSSSGGSFFKNPFGSSAGTTTKVTSPSSSPTINQVQQEAYDGAKARIAVARFTDKTGTGWYQGGIGDGMADQLTTALFNTNRFIVLERSTLADVLQEQDLGASGRIRQGTQAAIGQIEGAELLVTGAVTEFKGKAAGGGGGVAGSLGRGYFGTAGVLLGAMATSSSSAHMAIDIRVIDTRTSRIVAATSVEGKATDTDMGAALFGASGGGALGGSLGAWKNTPIEKALRQCIRAAVAFVVSKTPQKYYHYGDETKQAAAPAAASAAAPAAASAAAPAVAAVAPAAVPKPAPVARPARSVPDYLPGMVARVSSSRLNVRRGPGTAHPVVYSLDGGTPVLVLERQNEWIQVRDQSQRVGWTAAWLTYPDTTVSPEIFEPKAAAAAPAKTRAPAAAPVAKTAEKDDPIARLKKLEQLFKQEVITEEEYKALRMKILEKL
jgi:curli biogenesis system outer membrane secretion channel CsgG/SH3-like domain-containing protein